MAKPGKDDILKDLLSFFFDELDNDPKEVGDWLAQGDWDVDEFIAAARKLKADLALRD
jgi:hypothetical protein